MDFEKEIFNKLKINYESLIKYGFQKNEKSYVFSKLFMNNDFKVEIIIDDKGNISGKIFDMEFGDEYINYRIENQNGEFVGIVRQEYKKILKDIAKNCCEKNFFVTEQANRISDYIFNKYGDKPEFIWDKFPEYGVFRNQHNRKWYGIIMNIDKSKIIKGTGKIEILNLKINRSLLDIVKKKNGIYEAYHMNKKNWLTIVLNDSLEDEEIYKLVDISYNLVNSPQRWIIPANPKYYDVINCFNDKDIINWKQSTNIYVGDIIYIYVTKPYSAILYKCETIEVNIPYNQKRKDDLKISKVMKIKLLKRFNQNEYDIKKLSEYGVTTVRGPRKLPENLSKELDSDL